MPTGTQQPIGSTRLHNAGRGKIYRVVKTQVSGRWRYEHRCVMEQAVGRPLIRNEHVHHKNGNTLDNRLENLSLMLDRDHLRHHALAANVWSHRFKCCVECGSSARKHEARGLCTACFQRQPKVKQYRRAYLDAKKAAKLENSVAFHQ